MDSDLLIALFITLVGMTLLFLSLIIFYGLLSLVTRLFPERSAAGEMATPGSEAVRDGKGVFHRISAAARQLRNAPQTTPTSTTMEAPPGAESRQDPQGMLQAAAIAVALARAEAERGPVWPANRMDESSGDQPPSMWWTLHHRRQLDINPRRER